tara:strand:+ start:609 stop:1706 length:1098 start_codon:yes stop_codon:yes gene_type:complete
MHSELDRLHIAHIDCDAFYASVEKRDEPSLRDQPVIIGHAGARGVVTTACYIARQFGPSSAMPMFKAMQMCPQAVVIPPNMVKYREVSKKIRLIFLDATPVIQSISLDEAYLDLSDNARGNLTHAAEGTPAVVLGEVARRIEKEVGITVSIGLSHNKFLAKLASDLNKPRGYSVIGEAEKLSFLASLSVKKINGVGEITARRLGEFGVETIGQLQLVPEVELISRFGRFGRRLAGFAKGHDLRAVEENCHVKSVSAEKTFLQNTNSIADLIAAVEPLCGRIAQRLGHAGNAGGTVNLKLKTANFKILTRTRQLPHLTQRADIIFSQVKKLITREADGRFFRLIGVGVSDIGPAAHADPPDLFRTI